MQKRSHISIALFAILMISHISYAHAQSLEKTLFITETLPPYNYIENGTLIGTSVDILLRSLSAVNVHKKSTDIKVYPWARAYKILITTPNTCTLSTVKSPEREHLFKWVGPIDNYTCSFIRKNKANNINEFVDTHKYKIGAIRKSIAEEWLISNGHNIDQSSSLEQLLRKIDKGRINLIFSNSNAVFALMPKLGINPENYTIINTLNVGKIYFACNKDTHDSVIQKFQKGIDIIYQKNKIIKEEY